MKFYCPDCNQKLEADKDMLGTVITCPICSKNIKVPYPEPEETTAATPPAAAADPQKAGSRILAAGWACFGLGAVALLVAAVASVPLPAPLFLIASCGLGAFAIYRKRKVPGYVLVACAILLLPMSLVFVAQAFAARAQARFAAPAPRAIRTAPPPEPKAVGPVQEQPPPEVEEGPKRPTPTANARRILKPAELPPPGEIAEPAAAAVEPPKPAPPPEPKLPAAERKKIFALFMEADERATREAAEAGEDTDTNKGKKGQVQRQRKLAAKYKREIEEKFRLSPKQSREILAEGIDADLEDIPE
ncbi:hypothetical protein ACFLQU_04020 [Verrucomicrobiota bacterium]